MYLLTGHEHEDIKRVRQELVYLKKIINLQQELIAKLLAGECTMEIMEGVKNVRKNIDNM